MTPTVSYEHGACSVPLLGRTISADFRRTAALHGDRDALVVGWQGVRLTYSQLLAQVDRAARALLAQGVAPGDRVGVWAGNRAEWVVAQYATACVGAVLVNINPAYLADELAYVLDWSGVKLLLHSDSFRATDYAPLLAHARAACPQLTHTVSFDREWTAFLESAALVSPDTLAEVEASLSFDDAINIQYTSGTTGRPKGATLSHHNILNNAYFTGLALGYTPLDRVCIPVPFYHCFGMVLGNLACTAHGCCMVVPSESFSAAAALKAVADEKCTSLYGVPTMFRAVLDEPAFSATDVSSLRTGIMAGSPCPVELMKRVLTDLHMPEVAIGYGMTETSPLSTLTGRDATTEARIGTVGRVLPHVEIAIRDRESGRIVPRGVAGEFCTRGYSVMSGYWRDESATGASLDAGGWMHSGDLAVMEPDGLVRITGRLKDMIIRGGENISPREIEEALHAHPAVAEAQVIGIPSLKYGEEVMAWIRAAPGMSPSEDELRQHCRSRLAGYKVPKFWRVVEAFPMTVTGKIQKFRLRELAVELLGRQADAAEKTA